MRSLSNLENLQKALFYFLSFLICNLASAENQPEAQNPVVAETKSWNPDPLRVFLGLLNHLPRNNAAEIDKGIIAHFSKSQKTQLIIAERLLKKILAERGFANQYSREKWEHGFTLKSEIGSKIINEVSIPTFDGIYREINGFSVPLIENTLDLDPKKAWLLRSLGEPAEDTMSLVSGFLLRGPETCQKDETGGKFTRDMIKVLTLEGCIFDNYQSVEGSPSTVHFRLRPSKSLSPVIAYVEGMRNWALETQKQGK